MIIVRKLGCESYFPEIIILTVRELMNTQVFYNSFCLKQLEINRGYNVTRRALILISKRHDISLHPIDGRLIRFLSQISQIGKTLDLAVLVSGASAPMPS